MSYEQSFEAKVTRATSVFCFALIVIAGMGICAIPFLLAMGG